MRVLQALSASLFVCMVQTSVACEGTQSVDYENAATQLKGKVIWAKGQHPNGAILRYAVLKLEQPINVIASKQSSEQGNETVLCAKEVQLLVNDQVLRKKLKKRTTQVFAGSLFHEHTAWHRRKILMDVNTIF